MKRKKMTVILLSVVCLAVAVGLTWGVMLSEKGYQGPKSDHFDGTRFFNPNGSAENSLWDVVRWSIGRKKGEWPENYENQAYPTKVAEQVGLGINVMLVNHSSFLIQLDGVNILTDPIWSERASPLSWAGPKRLRVPGISIDSLPRIHLVLLTHNHYDHLDMKTIKRLKDLHNPRFIVPLGVDKILRKNGITDIQQLDWSDYTLFQYLRIEATPAIHFSGRGVMDMNKTLWCGFMLQGSKRLYFTGDTAYDKQLFAEIGSRFPNIDLAIIPVGAYKPAWFMSAIHTNPEEAVMIHQDIRSNQSIACHFGTFQLADEGVDEVPEDLQKARQKYGVKENAFFMPEEGVLYRF